MASYRKITSFIVLLGFPVLAHAHGEEVLVSIFAQAIAVITCLVSLQIVGLAKPHRLLGSIACILGVVLAEVTISDVPYNDNSVLITLVMVITPVLATIGAVFVGRANVKHKKRT